MKSFDEFVAECVNDSLESFKKTYRSYMNNPYITLCVTDTTAGKLYWSVTARFNEDCTVREVRVIEERNHEQEFKPVDVLFHIYPVEGHYTVNYKPFTKGYKVAELPQYTFVKIDDYLISGHEKDAEEHVNLTNGNVLMNRYGKYQPNLTFVASEPYIMWDRRDASEFNCNPDAGWFDVIFGTYFVSKKGTNCFRIEANGKHILIKDSWGGCFNKYRGHSLPENEAIYYHRAGSNGGGCGYDYAIYKRDWMFTLNEEDI